MIQSRARRFKDRIPVPARIRERLIQAAELLDIDLTEQLRVGP